MGSGEMSRESFTDFLKVTLGATASVSRRRCSAFCVHGLAARWRIDRCRPHGLRRSAQSVGVGKDERRTRFVLSEPARTRSASFGLATRRTSTTSSSAVMVAPDPTCGTTPASTHSALVAWMTSNRIPPSNRSRLSPMRSKTALNATTSCSTHSVGRAPPSSPLNGSAGGFGVEFEPRFVDVAIRRWQAFTRKDAVHVASERCFDEVAAHFCEYPANPMPIKA